MRYRNLKDLADATGFSRYQINRAIEAGHIRPQWLYKSPGSGRRKIRGECFGHCVNAMARWWGKQPEAVTTPRNVTSADFGVKPGEPWPLWVLAAVADVPLSRVCEAIESGEIPQDWLVEVP